MALPFSVEMNAVAIHIGCFCRYAFYQVHSGGVGPMNNLLPHIVVCPGCQFACLRVQIYGEGNVARIGNVFQFIKTGIETQAFL